MKYVKMLGLAVVAAAPMAFVGSSTASATVLCKTHPVANAAGTENATCPEGWAYGKGTKVHGVTEESFKLTTTFKNIECRKSTFSGTTENEGSATETVTSEGEIEILTFEECNCEVKVIHPGKLEIHWIPDSVNGTLTSKGLETTMSCSTIFGNVHCIYATGNGVSVGDLTGGSPATLDIEEANIPRLATSGLCSEKASWDGKYEITEPKPLYVANET